MAKLLRLRRGTNTQHTTFTGAEGEVTVNTTNDSLHVHDGTTAGGTELAKADLSNVDGNLSNNLGFGDSVKATFGASNDLEIYHNGSHSVIADTGTGQLQVLTNQFRLNNAANNENLIACDQDGNVQVYNDGAVKFATTSTGIDVTGTVTTDGLTSTGTNVLENTDEPQLILRDTDSSGSAARVQLEARGSDNAVDWFIGHTSTSNNSVTFMNEDSQPIYFGVGGSPRFELSASGHLVPQATNTYDLGTSSNQWRNGYFDGVVNCDGIDCDGDAVVRSGFGTVYVRDTNNTGTASQSQVAYQTSDNTVLGQVGYIDSANSSLYVRNASGGFGVIFQTEGTTRCQVNANGHFTPNLNNTYDIGTSSLRWRNIYTNDLNLRNEGSTNDVDGTWGSWTIQEGEDDLFLLNRRNGKKYKFNLSEVN